MRALILASLCAAALGCVRENPDARLDDAKSVANVDRAALHKLDCAARRPELAAARDESRGVADRRENFRAARDAYAASATQLETAFAHDPDLLYASDGDALRLTLQRCQAQAKSAGEELLKLEATAQAAPPPAAPTTAKEKLAASKPAPEPVVKKAKKTKTAVAARGKKKGGHRAVVADATDDDSSRVR